MNIIRIGNDERSIYIDTDHMLSVGDIYTDYMYLREAFPFAFSVVMKFRSDPIVIGIEGKTRDACDELRERLVNAWKEELPFPIETDGVYSR